MKHESKGVHHEMEAALYQEYKKKKTGLLVQAPSKKTANGRD